MTLNQQRINIREGIDFLYNAVKIGKVRFGSMSLIGYLGHFIMGSKFFRGQSDAWRGDVN